MESQYLSPGNHKLVATFLASPLYLDVKSCLLARRPAAAAATDEIHVAAAKGHIRAGFEAMIAELEKLPLESDPAGVPDPFQRPALDTRD